MYFVCSRVKFSLNVNLLYSMGRQESHAVQMVAGALIITVYPAIPMHISAALCSSDTCPGDVSRELSFGRTHNVSWAHYSSGIARRLSQTLLSLLT